MRPVLVAVLAVLVAHPGQAQDPAAEPTFGSVELEAGFLPDPHAVDLVAGGTVEPAVNGCAFGVVAEAPDVDLYYGVPAAEGEAGASSYSPPVWPGYDSADVPRLYIYAVSSEDTTVLVHLPDGSWACDDDGYGDGDPLLGVPAAPGLYDIWVGTFGEEPAEATLFISEVDPRE